MQLRNEMINGLFALASHGDPQKRENAQALLQTIMVMVEAKELGELEKSAISAARKAVNLGGEWPQLLIRLALCTSSKMKQPKPQPKDNPVHHSTRHSFIMLIAALLRLCGLDVKKRGVVDAVLASETLAEIDGKTVVSRSFLYGVIREVKEV